MRVITSIISATVICSMSCGHAGANTTDSASSEYISNVQSRESSPQREYQSDILRALDVKGKVKTISYDDWSFEFSPDGQPVSKLVESDDCLSLEDEDEELYASFSLTIKNGKMTKMAHNSRFFNTEFDFSEYNGFAPIAGTTDWGDTKIAISYPEKDSYGNWIKMKISFPEKEDRDPLIETREITYWPDDASMADFVPHEEIPMPSEELIFDVIRRVGKSEDVFSKDFNALVITYLNKTRNEGIGGSKNNFFEWRYGIFPSQLEIHEIRNFKHREGNGLTFIFSYKGIFPNGKTTDSRIGMIELIYEDGQWKIDDLTNEVEEFDSFHYATKKDYWKTRMSDCK